MRSPCGFHIVRAKKRGVWLFGALRVGVIAFLILSLFISSIQGVLGAEACIKRSVWHKQMTNVLLGAAIFFECPISAHAASYDDPSKRYHIQFADELGLKNFPKLVKTHEIESYFSSEHQRGLSLGITVDRVRKITTIRDFAPVMELAERVVNVEKGKEGVFDANIIMAKESKISAVYDFKFPSYEIEYTVDSSRGQNHFLLKATVYDGRLFVCTAQAREENFSVMRDQLQHSLDSFQVLDYTGNLENK